MMNRKKTEEEILFERAKKGDAEVLSHPMVAKDYPFPPKRTPLHELTKSCDPSLFDRIFARDDVATLKDHEDRTPLHELAIRGYKKALEHPRVATIRNKDKATPLHFLARRGVVEVLQHPKVASLRNIHGYTPLHLLGVAGVAEILDHPKVAIIRDDCASTPLHDLAGAGVAAAAWHPMSGIVRDNCNRTPLHFLAGSYCMEVLKHPESRFVRDDWGETPWERLTELTPYTNTNVRDIVIAAVNEQDKFEQRLRKLPKSVLRDRVKNIGCRDSKRILNELSRKKEPAKQEIER